MGFKTKELSNERKMESLEGPLRKAITESAAAFNKGDYKRAIALMTEAVRTAGAVKASVGHPYGLACNERIRYAKDIYGKKAVLFTRKVDGMIFFGIARCNREAGDEFDRELGVNLARKRAQAVQNAEGDVELLVEDDGWDQDVLGVTKDGMSGEVGEHFVHDLLDYFYQVTTR